MNFPAGHQHEPGVLLPSTSQPLLNCSESAATATVAGGTCTFCEHTVQAKHTFPGACEYLPRGHISQREAVHSNLAFVDVTSTIDFLKQLL